MLRAAGEEKKGLVDVSVIDEARWRASRAKGGCADSRAPRLDRRIASRAAQLRSLREAR
jgi:hypothetical protein